MSRNKMRSLFKGFRKSTTDLSEWSKNDEKLLKAVEANDGRKVESLMHKKTLLPDKLGPKGLSVFHIACGLGNLAIIDFLLAQGTEVNVLTIKGNTALHLAARNGLVSVVSRLIEVGAVLEHADSNGLTALHHSCIYHHHPVISILLQNGADVNVEDKTKKTPLFFVAHAGDVTACKELLDKGADASAADDHYLTVLMIAARQGHKDVCEILLKKGADPLAKDEKGESALQYAIAEGHSDLKTVFEKAPLRASWDLQSSETESAEPVAATEVQSPHSEMPEADQVDAISEFVPDNSPLVKSKLVRKDETDQASIEQDVDNQNNSRVGTPAQPRSLIDEKTIEAYKELEEEHEQMNEELHKLTLQNKTLQEVIDGLQSQIQEKDEQILALSSCQSLNNPKEHKLNRQDLTESEQVEDQSSCIEKDSMKTNDDSWNDSDEFDIPVEKMSKNGSDDGKMIAMLRNQIQTLHEDNDQLKKNMKDVEEASDVAERELLKKQVNVLSLALEKASCENDKSDDQFLLVNCDAGNVTTTQIDNENFDAALTFSEIQLENSSDVNERSKESLVGDVADTTDKYQEVFENPEVTDVYNNNVQLRADCVHLNSELERLQDTYNKLVQAGDNLQDMYDQLLEEKDQLQTRCEEIVLERDELLSESENMLKDSNAEHDEIAQLVYKLEDLQAENKNLQLEKETAERKIEAINVSKKVGDISEVVEVSETLRKKCEELVELNDQLEHDHVIVIEELKSVQADSSQCELDRDQIEQEYEAAQDELEQLQQQHDVLQQDYEQLEHDYSELLSDKEQLEQDFLKVHTATVTVEQCNPILYEEKQQLLQENNVLECEKEQQDLTIIELSNQNALLEEELTKVKLQVTQLQGKINVIEEKQQNTASSNKDLQIRSLQKQVFHLQQQLAESDAHCRDIVNTYRTHLLSAVQGHLDPSIHQALFNIIEIRSLELDC